MSLVKLSIDCLPDDLWRRPTFGGAPAAAKVGVRPYLLPSSVTNVGGSWDASDWGRGSGTMKTFCQASIAGL